MLRIGRTVAYRLARQYVAAGGGDLPCERFGKLMRVPRVLLEQKLGGPITWPIPSVAPATETPRPLRPTGRRRASDHCAPHAATAERSFPLRVGAPMPSHRSWNPHGPISTDECTVALSPRRSR